MCNNLSVLGRVVKDTTVRDVSNYRVSTTTIAVKGAGDKVSGEQKDGFFDVEAWGTQADFAEKFLTKGTLICVSGQLKQHIWVADDGSNRYQVKIVANRFDFVPGSKREDEEILSSDPVSVGTTKIKSKKNTDSIQEYDPFSD